MASRAAVAALGVRPDPRYVLDHWQYLSVDLLHTDLLRSLLYLHSQPPLWNLIVGLLLKLAGGDLQALVPIYLVFSLAVSALTLILVWGLTVHMTRSPVTAFAAAVAYALLSGAAYYENYLFYPLFTAFLATLLVFAAHRFLNGGDFSARWWAVVLASLTALCLTWSLFHPLLVLILPPWLLRYRPAGESRRRLATIVGSLAICGAVAFAPAIRNYLLFGIFSNGSWVGLNLAQAVMPGPPTEGPCGFQPVETIPAGLAASARDHPALTRPRKVDGSVNYNHRAYVALSRECAAWAVDEIRARPLDFAERRTQRFVYSNLMLSDQYFFPPRGWEAVEWPKRIVNAIQLPFRYRERDLYAGPMLTLVLSALVWGIAFLRERDPARRGFLMLTLALVAYLMLVGHVANRVEQNRMRFTVEPLTIVVLATGASMLRRRLGERAGRSDG